MLFILAWCSNKYSLFLLMKVLNWSTIAKNGKIPIPGWNNGRSGGLLEGCVDGEVESYLEENGYGRMSIDYRTQDLPYQQEGEAIEQSSNRYDHVPADLGHVSIDVDEENASYGRLLSRDDWFIYCQVGKGTIVGCHGLSVYQRMAMCMWKIHSI